jgi:hypothetical protein
MIESDTNRASTAAGPTDDARRQRSADPASDTSDTSIDSKEARESQQGDGVGVISASPTRAAGDPSHEAADGRSGS